MRNPALRFLLLPCPATACRAETVVLMEVGQIRAPSRHEAAMARPVNLRDVLTWRGGEIEAAESTIGSVVGTEAITETLRILVPADNLRRFVRLEAIQP